MNKKTKSIIKFITTILLVVCVITSCQHTSKDVIDNREQPINNEQPISSQQPQAVVATPIPSIEAASPTVAPRTYAYEAPEKLEYSLNDTIKGVDIEVDINAHVVLPQSAPTVVKVRPKDITYEQVNKVLGMLIEDRPLYHSDYKNVSRKRDIQNKIDFYNKQIESGGSVEFSKKKIKQLLKKMESAPETYAEVEVVCKSTLKEGEAHCDDFGALRRKSDGTIVLQHNMPGEIKITPQNFTNVYNLITDGNQGETLVMNTKHDSKFIQKFSYLTGRFKNINDSKIMEGFPLTLEEAIDKAKPFVDAIDPDMILSGSCSATKFDIDSDKNPIHIPVGHTIIYSRSFNGVNLNETDIWSWDESIKTGNSSYKKRYPQEALAITVGVDGIMQLKYQSPMDSKETLATEVELLPFDKIKEIFDKQIFNTIDNEDILEAYRQIDKIQLGMMRIAQPDSDEYLVVPVWDFYGRGVISRRKLTDKDKNNLDKFYGRSNLTINAIDGSIIDREPEY